MVSLDLYSRRQGSLLEQTVWLTGHSHLLAACSPWPFLEAAQAGSLGRGARPGRRHVQAGQRCLARRVGTAARKLPAGLPGTTLGSGRLRASFL